jgi:hypothetical protein
MRGGVLGRVVRLWILAAMAVPAIALTQGGTTEPYTDPRFLTDVPFGAHSHWLQPWRAYEETMPASRFVDGIGVGFTAPDGASEDLIAEMLARHGVRHARIEIGWGNLDWDDKLPPPTRERLSRRIRACASRGLRPLILLNAHHGAPCPVRFFDRVLAAPARKGDTTVRLTDTSDLVPGFSGLNNLTDYWAAEALATKVEGDTVTLSKPLPKDVGDAGAKAPMATLKYRPFSPPDTADYMATVDGWRRYVAEVVTFVAETLGTTGRGDLGFDVEIWNELSFGSNYLLINAYYKPDLYHYNADSIWGNVVKETAAYAEAHAEQFAGVRLCDGFSNTIPWPASSQEPPRVSALSKHPYAGRKTYPADKQRDDVVNALFGREQPPSFYPSYSVCFPEYFATYLQTESVCRDMAPITTDIYGTKHGRLARKAGDAVVPCDVWFTEVGFAPNENGVTDRERALALKAKTTARYYAFYLSKGVERLYLYAACEGDLWLGVVSDAFVEYAKTHTTYPEDDTPYVSPALRVVERMSKVMGEGLDRGLTQTRPITVESVSDTHGASVFAGDGTPEHPSLYHRDVLVVLPYQVNVRRFVIPYYVQTRDVLADLPPEEFEVTLRGLRAEGAKLRAYDPIADRDVPVTVLHAEGDRAVLRLAATDYPYLLVVEEGE